MGVFDDARDKAEEMIGNLTGNDDEAAEREAAEEAEEAAAAEEKAEILEEAQDAADRARQH